MTGIRFFATALLSLLPAYVLAADDCQILTALEAEELATYQFHRESEPWADLPPDAEYRLGEIETVRQDVFEQADNWLQRQANRLHVRTRAEVIRSILPMIPDDMVNQRLLSEAERILRSKVYLYDARVIPRRLCDGILDVYVVTRDVWTLTPSLNLDRSGGENDIGLGLGDTNIAGSGKTVSIGVEKDAERRGINFLFSDPNIADSRWAGDVYVVDNDDGERVLGSLRYPFFALHTRHAFEWTTDHFDRVESLYFLSDEVVDFQADSRELRVAAGWSTGLMGRYVNRFLLGYGYERHKFDFPDTYTSEFPDAVPPRREFAYPFVAFQRIEDDYDTRVNLDRVQRTEDLALGRRWYAELGYSNETIGGRGEYLLGRLTFEDAAWLTGTQLMTLRAGMDGYYALDGNTSENLTANVTAAYRWQHAPQWSLLVRGALSAAWNQTVDQQLLLGGETGLRGYPNRYQPGDRRFLLTVEERYYSHIYPLRMFRLGGAAFLDVGRAWFEGETPDWIPDDRSGNHFGVLTNVGVGLRLESTRTRGDRILHIDVALPLRDGPHVRGVEVTVTAKTTL